MAAQPTPEIIHLDGAGICLALRKLEGAHTATTGEQLTSPDFYARYCAGSIDTHFAAIWASFYEAYMRDPEAQRIDAAVDGLVTC